MTGGSDEVGHLVGHGTLEEILAMQSRDVEVEAQQGAARAVPNRLARGLPAQIEANDRVGHAHTVRGAQWCRQLQQLPGAFSIV